MFDYSLGFPEGISGNEQVLLIIRARFPVLIDVFENDFLGLPIKNGQAKGAFGDKMMAFNVFERGGEVVVVEFIIAGYDPDFTFVFDSNLGGSGDMTAGVE